MAYCRKKFEKIHPKYQTPSFSTIITGLVVGVPLLFTDKVFVLDFTSIATLFAFVLVCGGILLIPRKEKEPGKFNIPFINGKIIFPLIIFATGIFLALFTKNQTGHSYFSELLNGDFKDHSNDNLKDVLYFNNASLKVSTIILWIALIIISITTFIKNFSLIPLLGLSSCLYLLTGMTGKNWAWFASWLVLGLIVYFLYGYKKSKLAGKQLNTSLL